MFPINVPKNDITIRMSGRSGLILSAHAVLFLSASVIIPHTRSNITNTRNAMMTHTTNPINHLTSICRPTGSCGSLSKNAVELFLFLRVIGIGFKRKVLYRAYFRDFLRHS